MTAALRVLVCFGLLVTSLSAHAEDARVGVRMGVGVTALPAGVAQPMGSIHLDLTVPQDRFFLVVAPSLYLPVYLEGPLSYGGLGAELGAGWKLSPGDVTPYVGTGLSGRLQFSEGDTVLGAAPYAQLGVSASGIGDGRAFLELRAYQNVFPVSTELGRVYPTELGMHVGLQF